MECWLTCTLFTILYYPIIFCFFYWLCNVLLCHVATCCSPHLHHAILYYNMSWHAISYDIMLCYVIPCCPCYAMMNLATLSHVIMKKSFRYIYNLIYHFIPPYPNLFLYFLPSPSFHSIPCSSSLYSIIFFLHSGKFIMVKSDDVAAAMTSLFSTQVRTWPTHYQMISDLKWL